MGSNVDGPVGTAALGGRLVRMVGDRDSDGLTRALSRISTAPDPDGPDYGAVLTWVVDAIVEVVVARLGSVAPGETFVLEVRGADGSSVDFRNLPASGEWIVGTVSAFLAENLAEGQLQLEAAERQPDPLRRAEVLADALLWLDFLLDVDMPDPPDVPTA